MSGVQTVKVAQGDGGQRLDRWVKRQFPQATQGRIEKGCRKGEFRVDGARCKPSTRVEDGQEVRIPPLPDTASAPAMPKVLEISDADAMMMKQAVLYRDDHIIAINKPAGLPSQGGSKQTRHVDGLSEALRFGLPDKPRLVHRLDKDTSGVLLLARTRAVATALTGAFRSRQTRKIYWAVTGGVPEPRDGTIQTGLVKAGGHAEKMHAVHMADVPDTEGAKRAVSDYMVLEALARRAAWVALTPITGRTHQLRVHMAELGTPIIGDGKYGGSAQENLGDGWGAGMGGEISRKLHLHARYLSLRHPVTGKTIEITAPLPDHMARSWAIFGWRDSDHPNDPFREET